MSSDEKDLDPKWYCLRTQTKREHIAAAALNHHFRGEMEVFCPRIKFKKPTRRGVIWWVEPLFPGYFLAKFDVPTHLREILHLNGISGAVQFGRVLPEVPESFVKELQKDFAANEDGQNILPIQRKLGVGDEVEMVDGAFRGVEGVILEVLPSQERVRVLLELMGESRPVEIDVFSLLVREKAG
jgi:transcriptional antiterminator RfaH